MYLGNRASMLEVCTWRQNSDERSVYPLVALPPPKAKSEKARRRRAIKRCIDHEFVK
jgi:hypothetical protein